MTVGDINPSGTFGWRGKHLRGNVEVRAIQKWSVPDRGESLMVNAATETRRQKRGSAYRDDLSKRIAELVKDTPEQREVVGPLVERLCLLGWSLDQMRFGRHEWRVPKTPSEASKREKGQSFEGFPCDIAIFDSDAHQDMYKHLLLIIECKQPDENTGLNQLEIYLSNEPHAKLGVWANQPARAAKAIFVYRMPEGLLPKSGVVGDLPSFGDAIAPSVVKTTFDDLVEPNADILRERFQYLLDRVVARDSNVTRREDQLVDKI